MDGDPFRFPCNRTRREFLWQAGAGFFGTALTGLLAQDGFFGSDAHAATPGESPSAAKAPLRGLINPYCPWCHPGWVYPYFGSF